MYEIYGLVSILVALIIAILVENESENRKLDKTIKWLENLKTKKRNHEDQT